MNPAQYILFIFGVTDIRDIAATDLFSEILYHNGYHPRDCFHWIEDDKLIVINIREKAKLTFQFENSTNYSCIRGAMIHPSLPVAD